MFMTRIKSDTWDSGNSMTRFHEVIEKCENCNGEGIINGEECPECNGEGEIIYDE